MNLFAGSPILKMIYPVAKVGREKGKVDVEG